MRAVEVLQRPPVVLRHCLSLLMRRTYPTNSKHPSEIEISIDDYRSKFEMAVCWVHSMWKSGVPMDSVKEMLVQRVRWSPLVRSSLSVDSQ